MSTPPVVNTADGTCWTRREAVRDGEPLYAMADCERCPELVMATYAELAEHGIVGSADVLPMPVGSVPQDYPPALPWARLMDDEDLLDFLDELTDAATRNASCVERLAEVEEACGRWRLIAEAQHGHNTAPGPDAVTQAFAPVASLREDPHDSPLYHPYRVGHDLPETGGAR